MSNLLANYDPQFYASEALISLHKALGLANTVYRGYDSSPQQKGSVINISGPAKFSATDVNPATGGTTADLKARSASITLDKWQEVKFGLNDKELTFTKEQIISDHIAPAAYAIANAIDSDLATLIRNVGPFANWTSAGVKTADILGARKILFDNKAPVNETNNMFFMLDSAKEAALLGLTEFTQYQGSGNVGVASQVNGYIGQRFGFNFFANQNTPALTSGTATDLAGAVDGATSAGVNSIKFKALTAEDTFKAGDTFTIAGDLQVYAITKDVTLASATTTGTFEISPALQKDATDGAVITIALPAGSGSTKNQTFAYHKNCIALAMSPLSTAADGMGVKMGIATDPVTGLSLRSRLFYDGDKSTLKVAIDALWGKTVLDPNLGCRVL